MQVSPSLLAANFTELSNEIKRVEQSNANYLHLDIMDGNFVPNISFGPNIVKQLRPLTKLTFDVHLMISNPEKYLEVFKQAGADFLTYHYEITTNHLNVLNQIHQLGMKAGLSIKPMTEVEVLVPFLQELDLVLIMSVEPGFGGQVFMDNCLSKIKFLSDYKKKHGLNFKIEVDGGINFNTAKKVRALGADIIVAGTYLFNSQNMQEKVKELQNL